MPNAKGVTNASTPKANFAPRSRIIAVEPEGWDDMRRSLEAGEIVSDDTIKAELTKANPYKDGLKRTQIVLEELKPVQARESASPPVWIRAWSPASRPA